MRTCGVCHHQSPDQVTECPFCGADLTTESTTAQALRRLRADGRIREVRILNDRNCCPTCRAFARAYALEDTPALPIEGCSNPVGCRCVYEPVLDLVGP